MERSGVYVLFMVVMQYCILFLAMLQCLAVGERTPTPEKMSVELNVDATQIKGWSNLLSENLIKFSKEVTAFNEITTKYSQLANDKEVRGDVLVRQIADSIENLLRKKLTAVQELAAEAERIYENYTYDPDLEIEYLNSKKMLSSNDVTHITTYSNGHVTEMVQQAISLNLTEDHKFNSELVNHINSTVHVPTNVYDRFPKILNGAYWTKKLDEQFRENLRNDKSMRWQYFCSTDGFFRVFPGMKWPRDNNERGIDLYDCRIRSWYLQAATCPKNVLILLDTSGSMKGSRMVIARSTVKQILNTLDDDDYFNIIRFSNTIEYVDSCFNDTMMPATTQNKRRLQGIIDQNVTAKNGADFRRAFDEAFHLLNTREKMRRGNGKPLCNMAILLITDGVPEHYDSVFKYWTNNFVLITTRVFTFLIGREVDDDREVRWMACANRGYFSHISTLADVQENVQNYIKVMSRQMVISRYRNIVWTSIYLDHMSTLDREKGLQFMTSVAVPVFDTKNETLFEGNLLGVMGTDIPITLIKERIPVHKLGAGGYAFMINHNGYVLMHPDYRPFKTITTTKETVLNPYYKNIDLTDVTLPIQRKEFLSVIKGLLSNNEKFGSQKVQLMSHYDNMKRMVKRNYQIYRCKVENTDFSIGIALPPTSLRTIVSAGAVPSVVDGCLNDTDTEIAPWFYCKDLDPKLTGRERIEALKKYNSDKTKDCDQVLISNLLHDAQRLKQMRLKQTWARVASISSNECEIEMQEINETFSREDIELLFIGTKTGLTKYMTTKTSIPGFILNNTNTLDADYYRRAVEGIEGIDGQPAYTFTFSVPIGEPYNSSISVVTASASIIRNKTSNRSGVPTVFAVVGLEMKYEKFNKIFTEATMTVSSHCRGSFCSCQNDDVNCYLVDNHGYIVAHARFPDKYVGKFFGDIEEENQIMASLIHSGVFVGYNFTDHQSMCDIKASEKDRSSASQLLNPIKAMIHGLFWTITELFIFMSEFSLMSVWTNLNTVHAVVNEQADCDRVIADYDYESLGPQERVAYNQVKMHCSSESNIKKIIGQRPCQKSFKLYKADFRKQFTQSHVPGCLYDYSGCFEGHNLYDDSEGFECAPVIKKCRRIYTASWVPDTNLLLIITPNVCSLCDDSPVYDFGLSHREINETAKSECEGRKRSKYVDRKFMCFEFFKNETLTCGTADHTCLSLRLFLATLSLTVMRYYRISL